MLKCSKHCGVKISQIGSEVVAGHQEQLGHCTAKCPCHAYLLAKLFAASNLIIIIIITMTMFMVLSSWQSHCESSPDSFDECRMAPSGRRPKTKPDDLGCESACTGCQKLHPPSPFIITQLESWYSFYRPTEGRRLSRPWYQFQMRQVYEKHGRLIFWWNFIV